VITTAHGSDVFTLKGKILDWLKALVLRSSDAWTSNSRATADAIAEQASLPEPRILPMGVDVNHFQGGQRTRLRQSLPEDELLLLFVGRLVKEKGLDDLLEALALLHPDLRGHTSLWVVGDGQERSRLERYAQALGINGKVRFWGFISNDLLPNFYAAADLFVFPSMKTESQGAEGQGVVLLEAFAARLCVVATRAGGVREVVGHPEGWWGEEGHRARCRRSGRTLISVGTGSGRGGMVGHAPMAWKARSRAARGRRREPTPRKNTRDTADRLIPRERGPAR